MYATSHRKQDSGNPLGEHEDVGPGGPAAKRIQPIALLATTSRTARETLSVCGVVLEVRNHGGRKLAQRRIVAGLSIARMQSQGLLVSHALGLTIEAVEL